MSQLKHSFKLKESSKKEFRWTLILYPILILSVVFNVYLAMDKYLYPSPLSIALDNIGISHPKHRVLNIIKSEGIEKLPNPKELEEYQVKGIVESLQDPYSEYLNKEDSVKLWQNLNQEYAGIGIRVQIIKDQIVITQVFENSPAKKAGIVSGDVLKLIGGENISISQMPLSSIIEKIQGKAGTDIILGIERNGIIENFTVTRAKIQAPQSRLEIRDNIAIINIYTFGNDLPDEFKIIANEIEKLDIDKVIIDLRSNTGGLVESVTEIGDYFFADEDILVLEERKNQTIEIKVKDNSDILVDKKIVIIVNELTASASEILVGALQEQKGAYVIGQTTFGKGIVQSIYSFKDNTSLKLSTANWLTPNKNNINKHGIKPDRLANSEDSLDLAIEYLENSN